MELSTSLGNSVLSHYEELQIVCPPSLEQDIFTTAALDNLDQNYGSTTAEGSFHGTGVSLVQHRHLSQKGKP